MENIQIISQIIRLVQQYEDQASLLGTAISQCVNGLFSIADDIDKFHKGATITNVVGSSLGIAGGITTIVGVCLAPVTLGASLIVSSVGISVASAGGFTGSLASILDILNMKKKCKRARKSIAAVNELIKTMQTLAKNITSMVEHLSVLLSRLAQLGLGTMSTIVARGFELAAQGARALRVVTGVLSALFIIIDVLFVAKAARELQKGAKTIEAAQIREQAHYLIKIHDALQYNVENINFEKTKFVAEMFRSEKPYFSFP
ncbi:apolipoprotein L3-like [Hyperolius riggenbachi]|uniref:apolipoprotein L3-like n=1 Tax=Hyperolius riggenbachi TaxID=752182 RepID=UPI0035A36922